ncbi:MAG: hypothetical protein IJ740_09715 [Ruminococcus sp.]|nr:hypothetical protein [Ruminococcus sp.]
MIINSDCNEIPIVNGILYPNHTIQTFDVFKSGFERKVIFKEKIKYNKKMIWANMYIIDECFCESKRLMFYSGETSWGGDGFILCEYKDNKDFLWLLSSSKSNPFISIKIVNGYLFAENNCREIWKINMLKKEIKVEIVGQSFF